MIKKIPGTNGAYGCDTEGNVYSFYLRGSHERKLIDTPQKLYPYQGTSNQYLLVGITLDGHTQNCLVHRLVALTWLDNPHHYTVVHHKDGNIHNNAVDNLEWTTQQQNVSYAQVQHGALNGLRTKTKLYGPDGFIDEFDSISSAADYCRSHFGISSSSIKKYHQSHGYYIVPEYNEKVEQLKRTKKRKPVWELFTPQHELLGEFNSIAEAGRYIKTNIRDISIKLFQTQKKAYGYYVKEKCRD